MRKAICAALPLALLVLAAPAAARDGRHHTTYRATLAPVVAEEPTASASRKDAAEDANGVRGKAVLVDRKRRDRVELRVRGLSAGERYTWEVRRASGDGGACAGDAVAGFRYRSLKVRRHGGGKARGFSRSFAAEDGVSYRLVVSGPEGDVACGEFESTASGKRSKGGKRHSDGDKGDKADEAESKDESGDEESGDEECDEDMPSGDEHESEDDSPGEDDEEPGDDESEDD